MNSITISGDLRKKLSDCKVGESEKIEVTIIPTRVGADSITADVKAVEYDSGSEDAAEAPAPKRKPTSGSKRPKALVKAINMY